MRKLVIIPTYNEKENISAMIDKVFSLPETFEMLVIDDGSPDGTAAIVKERQQEYYSAQQKYADYLDSHDNIILQSVRAEQERLQNDMSLAYQVYSQVASQLQVARAKVQEEKPVFAVVEPAVVPLYPSGTSRKVYVLVFVFLSVCIVISWNLFGKDLLSKFKEVCA